MSKSDEFVFINSRPSGADTLQSVNQTCIKLWGSESTPDPAFWRADSNQREEEASAIFFFYFLKVSSAVQQNIRASTVLSWQTALPAPHGHLNRLWGVLPLAQPPRPSPSPCGWEEERARQFLSLQFFHHCGPQPEHASACTHFH